MPSKRQTKRPRRRPKNNLEHLRSAIRLAVTLKSVHKQEELYPINLRDLISRANVGSDSQIKMIGYTMRIQIATGNNCSTVTASVGHSGPWVRPSSQTDNFNQQFTDMSFNLNKEVTFHKRLLRESERQTLNPDDGTNFLNLRIRDPCGVIPGATILIDFRCELIRSVIDVVLVNGSQPATDRYEDQDVHTSGQPTPRQDVPRVIRDTRYPRAVWLTTDTASPYSFSSPDIAGTYTITVAGTANLVGEFTSDTRQPGSLQEQYAADGFAGTISKV